MQHAGCAGAPSNYCKASLATGESSTAATCAALAQPGADASAHALRACGLLQHRRAAAAKAIVHKGAPAKRVSAICSSSTGAQQTPNRCKCAPAEGDLGNLQVQHGRAADAKLVEERIDVHAAVAHHLGAARVLENAPQRDAAFLMVERLH